MYLEPEELRAIIEGKRIYRICPRCEGNGQEYYKWDDKSQSGEVSFITPQEYWNDPNNDNYGTEPCNNCEAVGYVIAVMEPDEVSYGD